MSGIGMGRIGSIGAVPRAKNGNDKILYTPHQLNGEWEVKGGALKGCKINIDIDKADGPHGAGSFSLDGNSHNKGTARIVADNPALGPTMHLVMPSPIGKDLGYSISSLRGDTMTLKAETGETVVMKRRANTILHSPKELNGTWKAMGGALKGHQIEINIDKVSGPHGSGTLVIDGNSKNQGTARIVADNPALGPTMQLVMPIPIGKEMGYSILSIRGDSVTLKSETGETIVMKRQ